MNEFEDEVIRRLGSIEQALLALVAALGLEKEQDDEDAFTLDGHPTGAQREPGQSLG